MTETAALDGRSYVERGRERGFGVLHYDEHYDRLAPVLGFESRWIVPRGSV